jgi:hypothetical protein
MTKRIITRAQATEEGLKRYYPGWACPKGHVSEHFVSNGACVACISEYNKKTRRQKHHLVQGRTPRQILSMFTEEQIKDAAERYETMRREGPRKVHDPFDELSPEEQTEWYRTHAIRSRDLLLAQLPLISEERREEHRKYAWAQFDKKKKMWGWTGSDFADAPAEPSAPREPMEFMDEDEEENSDALS